ncbi:hypothetical protein A1351_06630 [Methylosinus sp. R-45379]|uniref:hypothetical protein n=1 Tax=Methylosinus sp. R-45379 TaxID=980563 RepID=UPI0007C8B36A|nr:hypothetical protein [Methylosinus sp. R-45379]OAI31096.1 hypothetical protein A1351_06630 [Methylosinus sp. R-45379]
MQSRTIKIVTNGVSQLFDLFTRLSQQIIIVPILLLNWKVEVYSSWLTSNAIAGFFSLFSAGLISYLASAAHIAWTREEYERAERATQTTGFALVCLCLVGIGASLFLLFWYSSTVVVLSTSAIIWIWAGFFGALYRMADMYSRGLLTANGVLLIQTIALGVTVSAGGDISMASWTQLATSAAGILYMFFDMRRLLPGFSLMPRVPSAQEIKFLLKQCPVYFSFSIGSIAFIHTPILLLGIAGAANQSVVEFSLVRTISGVIRQVCGQLGLSFGTELARLRALRDTEAFSTLLHTSVRILSALNGVLAGALASFGMDVVDLWTKGAVRPDFCLLLVFSISPLLTVTGNITAIVLSFAGMPADVGRAYVLQTLLVVTVGIGAALTGGALSMALAVSLAEVVSMGGFLGAVGSMHLIASPVRSMSSSLLVATIGFLLSYSLGALAVSISARLFASQAIAGLVIWSPFAVILIAMLGLNRRSRAAAFRYLLNELKAWRRLG